MENKYYTPSIEEFHVGFEYYIDNDKYIFSLDSNCSGRFKAQLAKGLIKVKYLDEEDIISLGFSQEFVGTTDQTIYTKRDVRLTHTNNVKFYGWNIVVRSTRYTRVDTCFKGVLKNKSELVKLLKQLNID